MKTVRGVGVSVALALAFGVLGGYAGQAQQSAPGEPVQAGPGHDALAGVWTYDADDSVNAATGRPEMNLDQRRAAGFGRPSVAPGGRDSGGGGAAGGGTAGSPAAGTGTITDVDPGGGLRNPGLGGADTWGFATGGLGSAIAAAEMRRTQRDLLEIARRWTIGVTADAVTFKDDLDRERTYATDDKKQKYLLGAAEFEAKTHWDGVKLVKEIEASYGFKMTETYSVSSDGARLFAIIRVLGRSKDAPVVGANRVYDRVQSTRGK
jgi:hypothetical protein